MNIPLMPIIISLCGFAVTFLLMWCGILLYRQAAMRRAIVEKIQGESTFAELLGADAPGSGRAGVFDSLISFFARLGKRAAEENTPRYSHLRNEFLKAGIRNHLALPAFWGVKFVLMAVLPFLVFFFRMTLFHTLAPGPTLAVCIAAALAGTYLPDLWLRLRIASRKERISAKLPDALDMMVVCVEAGLGLDAAISKVAEEVEMTCRDLSNELKLYNLEIRAGSSRQEALQNLVKRTELEEIQSLVSLLIQTDRFGTSLAQGLRIYADSFRTKRFMRAEEKAAKLPTMLMIPVLFFIFPALFVVIALPGAMRIYTAFIASP